VGSVTSSHVSTRPTRRVRDRNLVTTVLAGVARNWLSRPDNPRSRLLANMWLELKCYGAPRVQGIGLSRIRGIDGIHVDGPIRRHSPLVVTALARLLQAETVFELGPDTGDTVWLLAHNLPNAHLFWLDDGIRPAGERRTGRAEGVPHLLRDDRAADPTADAPAITRLRGDSASYDLRRHSGTADLVYIEASHRHDYLISDTDAAFGLLADLGSIIWDGYSGDPGVYAYLNELAPKLDRPIFHILGTRLAFYSRWDIVVPELA